MGYVWIGALSWILLSSCAITRRAMLPECSREESLARGYRDGLSGRNLEFSYRSSCSPDSRVEAALNYREGHDTARIKRGRELEKTEVAEEIREEDPLNSHFSAVREPSAASWICEVEASSKVFTGVGANREEALGSARSSCGSHLQASSCEKADCKRAL